MHISATARGEHELALGQQAGNHSSFTIAKLGFAMTGENFRNGQTRRRFNLKEGAEGVVVTGVDNNSDAAEKRIAPGYRILEINQQAVSKPEDVVKKIEELKQQGRRTALLFVATPTDDKSFVPLPLK